MKCRGGETQKSGAGGLAFEWRRQLTRGGARGNAAHSLSAVAQARLPQPEARGAAASVVGGGGLAAASFSSSATSHVFSMFLPPSSQPSQGAAGSGGRAVKRSLELDDCEDPVAMFLGPGRAAPKPQLPAHAGDLVSQLPPPSQPSQAASAAGRPVKKQVRDDNSDSVDLLAAFGFGASRKPAAAAAARPPP